MKNAIYYFYNIIIDNIYQTKTYYYFDHNNEHYVLVTYFDNPNNLPQIYNLHLKLLNNKIYVHQIILNKENNIITIINGTPYILMKTRYFTGKINFNTVLTFSNIAINNKQKRDYTENYTKLNRFHKNNTFSLERNNIEELWSIKNDYLEYQINQLGQKYKLLKNSFNYYIGLGETAILLISSTSNKLTKTICHKRIKFTDDIFSFYNPLNLIIDSKTRDIAEYLKTKFFNGNSISKELKFFLSTNQLTMNDHITFLARMIYPTYYFDSFEKIISGKESENKIKKITALSSNYETILRKIYKHYRKTFNIEPIEWLE